MNTEHHTNPSHPENEKSTEELSKQRLEALMRDAEAVFSGIGEQIKSIGDTHLQRHDEMVARDEVRLRPLQQLRRTILASLESGELDRSTFDRIQELDDQARTGNGLVTSQTEYLYTPDSTVNVVAGLVENRGLLEHKAQDYVNEDPSNQDNLSDSFFEIGRAHV